MSITSSPRPFTNAGTDVPSLHTNPGNAGTTKGKYVKNSTPTLKAADSQSPRTTIYTCSTSVSAKVIKSSPLPTREVNNTPSYKSHSQVKPTSYYETVVSCHDIPRWSSYFPIGAML